MSFQEKPLTEIQLNEIMANFQPTATMKALKEIAENAKTIIAENTGQDRLTPDDINFFLNQRANAIRTITNLERKFH